MLLTEQEISEIPSFPWEKTVDLVRRMEARIEEKLKSQEPVGYEWVEPEKGLCISHNEPPEYEVYQVKPLYLRPLPPADVVRDAERYRWLRDTLSKSVGGGVALVYEDSEPGEEVRVCWYPNTPIGFYERKAETLDAAIDAAMKGGKV